MATSKKNSNSSKTAHVMNLLSKRKEPAPQQESEEAQETQAPAAKEARSAPLPPVMASLSPDAAVSNQIRSALEDALEEELLSDSSLAFPEKAEEEPAPVPQETDVPEGAPPASQAEEDPAAAALISEVEEPVSAPQDEPKEDIPSASPEEIQEESAPEPPAADVIEEAPVSQETSTQEAAPQIAQAADPTQLICFNVMEELVEEKLEKYVNMFGLCSCPRCLLDVKSLALTNLPALYVGIPLFEKNFRLAIYEKRYDSAVTAQILRACKIVMENPRHQENT